ncbi:MAG: hypothetical protein ACLUHA_04660 [Bacteroides stercoris]
MQKKIAKNQFDFNDFLSQIAQIKKMGNLKELASMIPVGKAIGISILTTMLPKASKRLSTHDSEGTQQLDHPKRLAPPAYRQR